MNLADAIRQAAYAGGPIVPENQQPYAPPAPVQQPASPQPAPQQAAPKKAKKGHAPELVHTEHPPMPAQTTMMRMELFLSPEQLSALFKAVVAIQHTVMTLREAASCFITV